MEAIGRLGVMAAFWLPALAWAGVSDEHGAPTLESYIRDAWKLPAFDVESESVLTTIPLRVSTYLSTPTEK